MLKKSLFWMTMSAGQFLRRLSDAAGQLAVRRFSRGEQPWPGHAPGEQVQSEAETRELDEMKHEMLSGVIELGDMVAREIMVPRTDMICIPVGLSLPEVLAAAVDSEHSRIPVYEEKIDNIVGILYAKDLFRIWKNPSPDFDLRKIIRPAYFIPETKPLAVLLKEFQRGRVHMAIVVDEYGGVAGLATLEDILEEITGDIRDEYDENEEQLTRLPDGDMVLDARLDIETVGEALGIDIEKDEFESLGGLAITILGHLPRQGENFTYQGFRFIVEKATERKVVKIRIKRLEKDGDQNLPG